MVTLLLINILGLDNEKIKYYIGSDDLLIIFLWVSRRSYRYV